MGTASSHRALYSPPLKPKPPATPHPKSSHYIVLHHKGKISYWDGLILREGTTLLSWERVSGVTVRSDSGLRLRVQGLPLKV